MADANPPTVAEIEAELMTVAKELDTVAAEQAAAPAASEAPAVEATAPVEAPAVSEAPVEPVPTADIRARLADPAAPADFEDRADSVGNVFRVYADGRPTELLPKSGQIR